VARTNRTNANLRFITAIDLPINWLSISGLLVFLKTRQPLA
jgi:hypothetical protein